jgi:hypothetical protein
MSNEGRNIRPSEVASGSVLSVCQGLLFVGFDELVPCRFDLSFLINTTAYSHVLIETANDSQ